jgi:hypothetical protein
MPADRRDHSDRAGPNVPISVARLTAAATPRKPIDATLTARMPSQSQSAANLVRSMRNGDRY